MASPPPDAPKNASGAEPANGLNPVFLAVAGLVVLLIAIVLVAVTTLTGAETAASAEETSAQESKLPVHYTVRKGDNYVKIAEKVGLKVEDLETFNPYVNPATIRPGQRLKLRATAPKLRKRGPIFHKVRKGDSLGSIAFRWGRTVPRLKALNPKLKDTELQPGMNVRLRR